MENLTWSLIAMWTTIAILIITLAFLIKKLFDVNLFADIIAKLSVIETIAESEIIGKSRGKERMEYTCHNAVTILSEKEMKLVNRRNGIKVAAQYAFSNILLPVLKKKFR